MRTTDEIVKTIKRIEKKKDNAAQLDLWNVDYFRYSAMLDVLNGRVDDIESHRFYDRGCYRDWETDRKSTRLNSSHSAKSRMPSSA